MEEKKKRRSLLWIFAGLAVSLAASCIFTGLYGMFRSRAKAVRENPIESAANIQLLYSCSQVLYRDLYNAQHKTNLSYTQLYYPVREDYKEEFEFWKAFSEGDRSDPPEMDGFWGETEDASEDIPAGIPERAPEEVLEETPEDVPEAPEGTIGENAEDIQGETPEEADRDFPGENLTENQPGNQTENQPEDRVEIAGESQKSDLWKNIWDGEGSLTDEAEEQFQLYQNVTDDLNYMDSYFAALEGHFESLRHLYDYVIRDEETGKVLTNAADVQDLQNGEGYYFCVEFCYDDQGIMNVGRVKGEDSGQIRRYAASRSLLASDSGYLMGAVYGPSRNDGVGYYPYRDKYTAKNYITDCSILFGMRNDVWEQVQSGRINTYSEIEFYPGVNYNKRASYMIAGVDLYYLLFLLGVFLLALFVPFVQKGKPWEAFSLCRMPLEGIAGILVLLCALTGNVIRLVVYVEEGRGVYGYSLKLGLNILCLWVLFFAAWFAGISLRMFRDTGIVEYVKKRSLIYRFFPYMKSKALELYRSYECIDLTKNARKSIIRLVLINAVILFIISSLWVGGFFVTAIYSVILYFLLKKYVNDLQKRYSILLRATNEIAEGNLNVIIPEHLGVFEPFKPQIYRIQWGFKKAIEEEMKSQRMKAELITNVSHDLKTPLTAIITYIGLLKEEGITDQQRGEYLDTLERKSMRLKVLIEDLFEISKATSRTVKLDIMEVDVINLVKQVAFEMTDKLKAAQLELRMSLPEEKVILLLDSQKTYRIYENLFGNIAKYALPGTRVYVNCNVTEDEVSIVLKNITAQELHVDPEELTDRFVRGDASRNTEGSGLGLAIVKSFMELQNGRLVIEIDDDLFKVTTLWKRVPVPPRMPDKNG